MGAFLPNLPQVIKQVFTPVALEHAVSSLIAAYQEELGRIERLSELMQQPEAKSVLVHFIVGNKPEREYTMENHINGLFCLVGARAHLGSVYWQKALDCTDVMGYMPQERRDQWHEQIRNPLGVRKRDSSEFKVPPLPAFEEDTVRVTLLELLNSRARFFAERVDGVFRSLSRSHVTNQPEGFSKRMILPGVISEWGSIDWSACGYIDDLRCVIAKFMGRDEPGHGSTSKVIEHIRKDNGQWQTLDGGAIRMRVYNGVGTAHIEVHEDMAWRLNAVLAMLYPVAIPEKNRVRVKKTKAAKVFDLMDKLLPFQVIDVLSGMEQAREIVGEGRNRRFRSIPNTLGLASQDPQKDVLAQIEIVMAAIGGVKEGRHWVFDYDPTDVVGQIVCTGAIPDHVSHQFYPTPDRLAAKVVSIAAQDASEGMLWLEPSAGTGSLATHVPTTAQLHCVEINALHAQILRARGFQGVFHEDFLVYAQTSGNKYDRIVMNPPFSGGRWLAHLEAATKLLSEDGVLVAILPASAKDKELIRGYQHNFSKIYSNEFAGTSTSVVIVQVRQTSSGGV